MITEILRQKNTKRVFETFLSSTIKNRLKGAVKTGIKQNTIPKVNITNKDIYNFTFLISAHISEQIPKFMYIN